MHTKSDLQTSVEDIGARLALARRVLVFTRFQMARLIGTDMPTWGTYEAGLARIPVEQALKLSAYGIPLDWIYEGQMADLHPHVGDKSGSCRRSDEWISDEHSARPDSGAQECSERPARSGRK